MSPAPAAIGASGRAIAASASDIDLKVATTLGQPYGVIFRADASGNFVSPPEDSGSLLQACVKY